MLHIQKRGSRLKEEILRMEQTLVKQLHVIDSSRRQKDNPRWQQLTNKQLICTIYST